jgi:hypothetical protein
MTSDRLTHLVKGMDHLLHPQPEAIALAKDLLAISEANGLPATPQSAIVAAQVTLKEEPGTVPTQLPSVPAVELPRGWVERNADRWIPWLIGIGFTGALILSHFLPKSVQPWVDVPGCLMLSAGMIWNLEKDNQERARHQREGQTRHQRALAAYAEQLNGCALADLEQALLYGDLAGELRNQVRRHLQERRARAPAA